MLIVGFLNTPDWDESSDFSEIVESPSRLFVGHYGSSCFVDSTRVLTIAISGGFCGKIGNDLFVFFIPIDVSFNIISKMNFVIWFFPFVIQDTRTGECRSGVFRMRRSLFGSGKYTSSAEL